jgi:hypothetical protein
MVSEIVLIDGDGRHSCGNRSKGHAGAEAGNHAVRPSNSHEADHQQSTAGISSTAWAQLVPLFQRPKGRGGIGKYGVSSSGLKGR